MAGCGGDEMRRPPPAAWRRRNVRRAAVVQLRCAAAKHAPGCSTQAAAPTNLVEEDVLAVARLRGGGILLQDAIVIDAVLAAQLAPELGADLGCRRGGARKGGGGGGWAAGGRREGWGESGGRCGAAPAGCWALSGGCGRSWRPGALLRLAAITLRPPARLITALPDLQRDDLARHGCRGPWACGPRCWSVCRLRCLPCAPVAAGRSEGEVGGAAGD